MANITPNDEKMDAINQPFKDKSNTEFNKSMLLNDSQEWNPRFVLKSHFDCVRCLKFHNKESLVVTGSEDETIKLWNLNKAPLASNKSKFEFIFCALSSAN